MAKHNVDLGSLSPAQLEQLIVDAQDCCHGKRELSHLEAVKAAKDSGELKRLKDELKALKQESKNLSKFSFELFVPITFTIEAEDEDWLNSLDDYDSVKPDELFDYSFSGKISPTHDLSTKQYKLLNESVRNYVDDACDDIIELAPDDFHAPLKAMAARLNAFLKDVKKLKLEVEDL